MHDDVLDLTSNYMDKVHDPDRLMRTALDLLKDVRFDTLVGTGLSGALAVPELARRFGVNYLIVRKPNDGTHSWLPVEGKLGRRWVFVDDLIASGATFARVWDAMNRLIERYGHRTEFMGAMLYDDYYFHAPTHTTLNSARSKYSEWDKEVEERKEQERLEAAKRQAEDPMLAGFTKTGTTEDGGEVWTKPYTPSDLYGNPVEYPTIPYTEYRDAASGVIRRVPLAPNITFDRIPEDMQGKYIPGTPEYYERLNKVLGDLTFTVESKPRFSERYGLTKSEAEPATV